MPGALTWQNEERCVVGETVFQTLPVDLLDRDRPSISTEGADFLLFKERPVVERYVELIGELRPRHVVELGVMEGGGTALLFELAHPRRMVAVDRRPPMGSSLRDYVARRGIDNALRIHDDVDQSNRRRLAEIIDEAFGDEALDLVVDDCSHLYEATRASFNELFPRVRPGGLYVIEDWPWAHEQPLESLWADQIPLTRFVFELTLAIPSVPGLISEIAIDTNSVRLKRGDASVGSHGFDVSAHLHARGLRLLRGTDARNSAGAESG